MTFAHWSLYILSVPDVLKNRLSCAVCGRRTYRLYVIAIQEAQAAGCRTSVEADRYIEQKRKREAEEIARRAKENAHVGPSSQGGPNAFMASDTAKDTNPRPMSSSVVDMDNIGFNGTHLLSEAVSIRYSFQLSYIWTLLYLKVSRLMSS